MKNNKGFTLVELLAVIAILALLVTIAVPSVISISRTIKKNMFCSKVDNIESAAKIYVEDNDISSSQIKVKDLLDNNILKKEETSNQKCNCPTASNCPIPCVKDPRDGTAMDFETITIQRKNKQITATYDKKSDCNSK